jgi:uncharacterized membrane protein
MKTVALLVLTFLLMVCAGAGQYQTHNLGVLPGDGWGAATRINSSGQVLGYSQPYGANDTRGVFLWSQEAGMTNIRVSGLLDFPGGINDGGRIVGWGESISPYDETATILETDGTLTVLQGFSDASYDGGMDINTVGQVVGWSHSDSLYYAALWDTNGDIVVLGGGTEHWSGAQDINSCGQVAWTWGLSDGKQRACRWDKTNGATTLPLLPNADFSEANAINDSGWIVGKSGNHAVLWGAAGSILDLGTSSLQYGNGAEGINNHGQIVGELGGRAVLWNADGMIAADLDALLDDSSGTGASAINDDGWVAGYRLDEYGNEQPVVWELVPEPSSLLVLACGITGISALTLKRRRASR